MSLVPVPDLPEPQPAASHWSLLFEADGSTVAPLAELLVANHNLRIAQDEGDLVALRTALEIARDAGIEHEEYESELVRCGQTLPLRLRQAIETSLAELWGVPADSFEQSAFGYPPLPLAWAAREDGSEGRYVPPGFPRFLIGHPVFWLPEDVLRPMVGEGDDHEHREVRLVRLSLELAMRGYFDPETGMVKDVLVANGLDYRDPRVEAMLDDFVEGNPVAELDALVLSTPEIEALQAADPGAARAWAIQAAKFVRDGLPELARTEAEDVNYQALLAITSLEMYSMELAMEPLEVEGKRWIALPHDQRDHEALCQAAEDVVEDLETALDTGWLPLLRLRTLREAGALGHAALEQQVFDELAVFEEKLTERSDRWYEELGQLLATAERTGEQSALTAVWNLAGTLWLRQILGDNSLISDVVGWWKERGPVAPEEIDLEVPGDALSSEESALLKAIQADMPEA